MSLGSVIVREPDEADLTPAERRIYATLLGHVAEGQTSALRAVLRTARSCGVSRTRVTNVVRKVNRPEDMPW